MTRRGWTAALLFLAALALLLPPPLGAAERTTETEEIEPSPPLERFVGFGIGWQTPLASPGQPIPIWAILANADGLAGEGTRLRLTVQTTTLSVLAEVPLAPRLFAGLRGGGTTISGECAPYRYEEGERIKDLEIASSCAGAELTAGLEPADGLRVRAFAGGKRIWFARVEETAPGLVKPAEHTRIAFGVEGSADFLEHYLDWQVQEGFEASFCAAYRIRDVWRSWGLPSKPQTRPGRHKEGARASFACGWAERLLVHHNLRLALEGGVAWDADVLSSFHLGSTVGTPSLPGAYYGEIAADRYLFCQARYGLNLWTGARGWVTVKAGGFRETGGPTRGALGVSVGVTQKIFFGMPLTVEYGFCPTVDRKTGCGGHEVSVLLVGAVMLDELLGETGDG